MRRQIVEVLSRSPRPLDIEELQAALPGSSRDDVEKLVDLGLVHPCARGRFWDRDEVAHFVELARARLQHQTLSRKALVTWLAEVAPDSSARWRHTVYARLRDAPGVWEWPSGAGERAPRLANRPPDPERYLQPVKQRFERVRDRLTAAGLPAHAVTAALTGSTVDPEPLAPDRRLLHELAFAWSDAPDAAARAPLERVLVNIGARRLGERDETVRFDGRLHETDDDLFPDEPAAIEEPGWVHGRAQQRVVLVKARVRAVP